MQDRNSVLMTYSHHSTEGGHMTEKKSPEHGDEPRSEDLELDENHAKDVAGGDKAASGHVEIHDISITKTVDKSSPSLMQ
jgi:hypothetical protein